MFKNEKNEGFLVSSAQTWETLTQLLLFSVLRSLERFSTVYCILIQSAKCDTVMEGVNILSFIHGYNLFPLFVSLAFVLVNPFSSTLKWLIAAPFVFYITERTEHLSM